MLRPLYTLALVCALASPAAAQTTTITGTIIDQSGAAVPGATVTLYGPGGVYSGEYLAFRLPGGTTRTNSQGR